MILRRGLPRLFIAIAVPWSAYWGWQAASSSWELRKLEPQTQTVNGIWKTLIDADNRHVILAGDGSTNRQVIDAQSAVLADLNTRAFEASQQRDQAAWYLLGGLAALAAAILTIGWVLKCFRNSR